MVLVACEEKDDSKGLYCFGGGYIKYEATISYDFNSALDSLLTIVPYDQLFLDEPYYIDPEHMNRVNYPTDDRSFHMITVMDSINGLYLSSPRDVIDSKCCWYTIIWNKD